MLKKILLALDGSPASDRAAELAIRISREHGTHLTGIGVLDVPGITAPSPTPIGGDSFKEPRDQALLADAQARIDAFLTTFYARCNAAGGSCAIVESQGVPAEQIEQESQHHDLIMIGRDTNFRFETATEDPDTLRELAYRTPRPVIVVPQSEGGGQRVVVAYDGSLQASRALHLFVLMGLHRGHPVDVVSVYPAQEQARAACADAASLLRSHGADVTEHGVESPDRPAEVLLARLPDFDAGLVVMGSYGVSGLRSLFGSFTRTMLRSCNLPMFIYH